MIEAAGTESDEEIMMPLSLAAAARCDAGVRLEGVSAGADLEVGAVVANGGKLYRQVHPEASLSSPP